MQIEEYNETRRADWDAFVAAHPHASFRHLSGLFALEAETSGARNRSLVIYDERNRLVGLLPLFEVVEPQLRYLRTRTLNSGTTLPGGPLFVLSLSAKQQRDLLAELMAHVEGLARRIGAERVSISYPNVIGDETSIEHFGYLPLKRFGYREHNVVSLLLDLRAPRDVLFERLKYSCRKQINKCARDGLTFAQLTERADWLDCYDLNVQTLGRLAYTRRALELVWDEFVARDVATVTVARHAGRPLSVIVTVGLNASSYNWIAFNAKTGFMNGAHNFALWHTIELWQRRGVSFFEIGSMEFADAKQKNIGTFKESFGGRACYALGGTLTLKPARRAFFELLQLSVTRLRQRAPQTNDAKAQAPPPNTTKRAALVSPQPATEEKG